MLSKQIDSCHQLTLHVHECRPTYLCFVRFLFSVQLVTISLARRGDISMNRSLGTLTEQCWRTLLVQGV